MTKVSIIVPVYNDANGLKKSIRSVISQTLKDIEIICINDESGDDSLKTLNEFADEYDFIKVFSHENQGLSKARNFGMSKSAGEYVAFLDAGDVFVDESALENLYQFAQKNNADMVSGNIKLIDEGDEFSSYQDRFTEYDSLKPGEYGIPLSFHKNIFKREFIVNEDVIFPDLMIGQDSVFLAEILSKVNEIYTVPIDFYAHRYVDDAGQCNTREKRFDYIKHYKMVFDYLSDSKFDDVRHEYRYEMLDFINKMGVEGGKDILDASRDVFKDQPDILRNFEENFYFEHEKNPEMQKLVNFAEKANPSISVLIPVYNVSEFLDDSISCLLNQTFKDIELVCVNDGSTDNSLEILEEFSKNDSRIKIINKENGGCGSARNRALDEATGDYVYLYDPDDWIELDALEKVYKSAIYNDSDMVIFKANLIENNQITNSRSYFHLNKILKKKDYKRCSFNYRDVKRAVLNMGFAPWSKLYRKEFIDSYDDFRFDLGVAFDDVPFHVKSMSRAKRISFVNEYLYHYRWDNLNSVNHKSSNSIDIFKIIDIVEGILKNEGIYEEVESDFCKFIVNHVLFYIITADSEEYFLMTKERFSRIDEKFVPKNRVKYDLVLDIDDYMEFKFEFMKVLYDETSNKLNKNIAKLTNENEKLKKKNKKLEKNNKKLKKQNKELLDSTSWKVTKPLRKLRKGF
ncbi:glycosyltransferase [Methanobrevibacter sp. UBA212]|uniref:glycosyltransferase family 2 protein n=1 Tax=Methanobrevibacter sp. UBA212 TaxID=1915476 RepID=UPI0025F18D6E|nr:glycosyltransferase [Methanobrevibacter sp. UBA212]